MTVGTSFFPRKLRTPPEDWCKRSFSRGFLCSLLSWLRSVRKRLLLVPLNSLETFHTDIELSCPKRFCLSRSRDKRFSNCNTKNQIPIPFAARRITITIMTSHSTNFFESFCCLVFYYLHIISSGFPWFTVVCWLRLCFLSDARCSQPKS